MNASNIAGIEVSRISSSCTSNAAIMTASALLVVAGSPPLLNMFAKVLSKNVIKIRELLRGICKTLKKFFYLLYIVVLGVGQISCRTKKCRSEKSIYISDSQIFNLLYKVA